MRSNLAPETTTTICPTKRKLAQRRTEQSVWRNNHARVRGNDEDEAWRRRTGMRRMLKKREAKNTPSTSRQVSRATRPGATHICLSERQGMLGCDLLCEDNNDKEQGTDPSGEGRRVLSPLVTPPHLAHRDPSRRRQRGKRATLAELAYWESRTPVNITLTHSQHERLPCTPPPIF